jgi:hypothetical protein
VEVLINTPLVADHIRKGEVHLLKELMSKSNEQGMQTDQALYKLYSEGDVSYEAAIAHADAPNDLRLMIKLGTDASPDPMANVEGLSLEEDETTEPVHRHLAAFGAGLQARAIRTNVILLRMSARSRQSSPQRSHGCAWARYAPPQTSSDVRRPSPRAA